MKVIHRSASTAEYKGIPIQAFPECHEMVVSMLLESVSKDLVVLDVGAGNGALTRRIIDEGYHVIPVDIDSSEWMLDDVVCIEGNIEDLDIKSLIPNGKKLGAICLLEVLEHLENPRKLIKTISRIISMYDATAIISTPNPLDTFSCGSMIRRGCFGSFSPEYYEGGGHISILPYWLVTKHFEYSGISNIQWTFVAPYRPKSLLKTALLQTLSVIRYAMLKGNLNAACFDGQCAIAVIKRKEESIEK